MRDPDTNRSGYIRYIVIGLVAALALAGSAFLSDVLSFESLRDNRQALLTIRDEHYVLVTLGFCLAYVLIVVFSLPGATVASVTGGFLFGLSMGTALNVLAATIGASGLFLAVRWGFGAALADRIESSDGRIRELQKGLRDNEISVMFLLRLVPAVPFFVANLLPALVGVRFRNFVLTTALGIVPGALVFTWIGAGLGEVFARGEDPDLSILWEPYVVGPLLALAALAGFPILVRARRARRLQKAG